MRYFKVHRSKRRDYISNSRWEVVWQLRWALNCGRMLRANSFYLSNWRRAGEQQILGSDHLLSASSGSDLPFDNIGHWSILYLCLEFFIIFWILSTLHGIISSLLLSNICDLNLWYTSWDFEMSWDISERFESKKLS